MSGKWSSLWKNITTFEPDYFTVGGGMAELAYFIKQGNLWAHIVDRVKFRIFPRMMIVPGFPTHVDVEIASACQMRCPMCYTTHMPHNLKGLMDWDLYTKIIDQCVENKVYSVKLSWRGEPLLNPRAVDMVKYAKDKGIKEVALLSNAELLKKDVAEKLVDAGLDWISVSADGVNEIYNEIRAPADFEETKQRVAYLKKYRDSKGLKKPLIRVQSIMSAVEDIVDEYVGHWEDIVDRTNIIADNIREFKDLEEDAFNPYFVCPKAWERMTIAHDGKIHQCNTDYSGKMILGNANEQSLKDIWHGEGQRQVREGFRKHTYLKDLPACRQCSYGLKTETAEILGERVTKVQKYAFVGRIVENEEVTIKSPNKRRKREIIKKDEA